MCWTVTNVRYRSTKKSEFDRHFRDIIDAKRAHGTPGTAVRRRHNLKQVLLVIAETGLLRRDGKRILSAVVGDQCGV